MPEGFEGTTPPEESLEDLKYQVEKAHEEYKRLQKASENDPKDSELRVAEDKAYDAWHEARRKVAQRKGVQFES